MNKQEQRIVTAYLHSRLSEQQIADGFGLSSSRVRWVLKTYKVPKRTISEAIRSLHITKFNKKEFVLRKKLTTQQEKLKLAGAMLYWGEGTKKGHNVALANSDPEMVKLFVLFLRDICGIAEERLHVTLHHYPDHDPVVLQRFWSKTLRIPKKQFYAPYLHAHTKGNYKKKSQYGTVSIQYSDSLLLGVIKSWISKYSKSLSHRSSVGRAAHL